MRTKQGSNGRPMGSGMAWPARGTDSGRPEFLTDPSDELNLPAGRSELEPLHRLRPASGSGRPNRSIPAGRISQLNSVIMLVIYAKTKEIRRH